MDIPNIWIWGNGVGTAPFNSNFLSPILFLTGILGVIERCSAILFSDQKSFGSETEHL